MTDGNGATKTKRMGARFFKNPPQPHMCIKDSLKGSSDPCYINVLSWDKVALGMLSQCVPLYGGMKVCPPRTEKKEVSVFAVMANPEILKLHGKNALNPQKRSWLIEILMDFVEKMNEGVTFNRCYTVLRDRDITGELKEIWMVVQSERAKAQQMAGVEELRRPVPQYPHYEQQQQQLPQHPQHPQHSMPPHHQYPPPLQQQQQQQQPLHPMHHPHDEHPHQPPQYHSTLYYPQESNENCESYDLSCARQNMIVTAKERKYLPYENDAPRVDRYIFREPIVVPNPNYQYQQQIPRPMIPSFPPNIHPNPAINCQPSAHPNNPLNHIRPETPNLHYNKIPMDNYYENYHCVAMQSQPPPPMQIVPPVGYYDNPQNPNHTNFSNLLRPAKLRKKSRLCTTNTRTSSIVMIDPRDSLHVPPPPPPPPEVVSAIVEPFGVRISPLQLQQQQQQQSQSHFVTNNVGNTSMTNFSNPIRTPEARKTCRVCPNNARSRSKVMINPRDGVGVVPPAPPPPPEVVHGIGEHFVVCGPNLQQQQQQQQQHQRLTHFSKVTEKVVDPTICLPGNVSVDSGSSVDQNSKKPSTMINFLKVFRPQDGDSSRKDVDRGSDDAKRCQNVGQENFIQENFASQNSQQSNFVKADDSKKLEKIVKPKIKVLKRNKSMGDEKNSLRDGKLLINGEVEGLEDGRTKDGSLGKNADVDERLNKVVITDCQRNGNFDKGRTDLGRTNKTTTTLRNTLKILAGSGNSDDGGNKRKMNGHVKSQSDEVLQVYTILRKPEATTSHDEAINDLAELSLNDCGENGDEDIGAVIS